MTRAASSEQPVGPTRSPFDLTGKVAVVTGCRRGLGRAMSVALARAGADLIGTSQHLDDDGGEVAAEVRGLGREFFPIRTDFANRDEVESLAAVLSSRRVDILVNNAGSIARAPAVEHTDDDWDRVLAVDLSSQFVLTRAVGASMISRGSGKVIFTASLLSFQGGINVPGYAAAKSGIAGLTRALANEWAPLGVNVNAIAPGYIATDNTRALQDDPVRSRHIIDRIPAGRWGLPADLAGTVIYLASAASDYVHGVVLPVDGGWLAR